MLKEKAYTEPRLVIFLNKANPSLTQGFVAAEKELLFEVSDFTVTEGIISLIATYWAYHIQYPKPLPSLNFMLFVQEVLLERMKLEHEKVPSIQLHTVVSLYMYLL